MSAREEALRACKALFNGGDKLSFFRERGISEEVVRKAYIGYEAKVRFRDKGGGYIGPAFSYPCANGGRLLGIKYKSEERNEEGKRYQK